MAKKPRDESEPVIIRKYANRRLYNTETSCYVTLDHLSQMVKEGRDFVVRDAKSGDDITHSVLTQIIIEEEGKGETLLPIPFLRQLIHYYGDNMQSMVPGYLQSAMEAFTKNQDTLKDYMETQWQGAPGGNIMEEMARRNMAMFQDALKMFNPLQGAGANPSGQSAAEPGQSSGTAQAHEDSDLADMKAQLAAMQAQLEKMSKD